MSDARQEVTEGLPTPFRAIQMVLEGLASLVMSGATQASAEQLDALTRALQTVEHSLYVFESGLSKKDPESRGEDAGPRTVVDRSMAEVLREGKLTGEAMGKFRDFLADIASELETVGPEDFTANEGRVIRHLEAATSHYLSLPGVSAEQRKCFVSSLSLAQAMVRFRVVLRADLKRRMAPEDKPCPDGR